MKRELDGYFTVEAAMVLPLILATTVFIIYLLFFQYNRCLLEQDMGILALRGMTLEARDKEERLQKLREQAQKMYEEKYVAWEKGEVTFKLEKETILVKGDGQVMSPFGRWDVTVAYENTILSPVSFIRNYHKIIGGQ